MAFLIGFSVGVMLAASFFSLLSPSLQYSLQNDYPAFIPLVSGFVFGAMTLHFSDWILPDSSADTRCSCCLIGAAEKDVNATQLSTVSSMNSLATNDDHSDTISLNEINNNLPSAITESEDVGSDHIVDGNTDNERTRIMRVPKNVFLLVLAVTIHNIPEGFVQGISFGSLRGLQGEKLTTAFHQAVILAFAIGMQNIPEGLAVSIPLRQIGLSRRKSFFFGQFSGFVEVVGSLFGGVAVFLIRAVLPYALSFAAGAMLFVILKELIPRSQRHHKVHGVMGTMIGFVIMMFFEALFASAS
jgi:zinc transporter ZupT